MNLDEARKATGNISDPQERADKILELVTAPPSRDLPAGDDAFTHDFRIGDEALHVNGVTSIVTGVTPTSVEVQLPGGATGRYHPSQLRRKPRTSGQLAAGTIAAMVGAPIDVLFGTPSDARRTKGRYVIDTYYIDADQRLNLTLKRDSGT